MFDGLNIDMIKRITIRDVASYDKEGVTFDDLAKVNIIYGGNGTGKTTVSRVLDGLTHKRKQEERHIVEVANNKFVIQGINNSLMQIDGVNPIRRKKIPSYKRCKIEWEKKPIEVMVYNQDFKQKNLTEEMPGVFTIGGDVVKMLNQRKKRHLEIKKQKQQLSGEPVVYNEEGLREVNNPNGDDLEDFGMYSVEPAVMNINKVLKNIGFNGFRIRQLNPIVMK